MSRPLEQGAPRGGKLIHQVSIYTATVDFANLGPSGGATGVNVGIPQVKAGDVCLGVSPAAFIANEFEVYGSVVGNGSVRLSAIYRGSLTDGVDADNAEMRIAIAHIE